MPIEISGLRSDPDSNSDQSSDSEQESPAHVAIPDVVPLQTKQQLEAIITTINKKLRAGEPVDLSKCPLTLYVVHFRGVHFFKQFISQETRRLTRQQIKKGTINNNAVYSPAVYELAGLEIGAPIDTPDKKQRVKDAITMLNQRFDILEQSGAATAWWGNRRAHRNLLFQHYQYFVNEYQSFREESAARQHRSYQVMNINHNPYISTADGAKHAVMYALGGKAELNHGVLRPGYIDTDTGPRPKHPKTGYVQIFLHTLTGLKRTNPLFLSALHANNEIDIKTRVLNERETTFKASISSRHVFHTEVVRYPSFNKTYRVNYHTSKYGITQSAAFTNYRKNLKKDATVKKTTLVDILADHYAEQLLKRAHALAVENGGHIVYLSLDGLLQLNVPTTADISQRRATNAEDYKLLLDLYSNSAYESDSDDEDTAAMTNMMQATSLTDKDKKDQTEKPATSGATNSTADQRAHHAQRRK